MRDLELIGEALKYILNHQPFNKFVNREWRKIIDFRNVITHDYFGMDYYGVYIILCDHFPKFFDDFLMFAKKVNNKNLLDALNDIKKDMLAIERFETLEYLKGLEKILSP